MPADLAACVLGGLPRSHVHGPLSVPDVDLAESGPRCLRGALVGTELCSLTAQRTLGLWAGLCLAVPGASGILAGAVAEAAFPTVQSAPGRAADSLALWTIALLALMRGANHCAHGIFAHLAALRDHRFLASGHAPWCLAEWLALLVASRRSAVPHAPWMAGICCRSCDILDITLFIFKELRANRATHNRTVSPGGSTQKNSTSAVFLALVELQ